MWTVFKQSLELMWKGMLAIFLVVFLIYLVLLLFPKVFKNNSSQKKSDDSTPESN